MSQPRDALYTTVRDLAPSATLAINELSNELRRQGRDIYKFGLGQSPFPVPAPVVEALRQNAAEKDYLPVAGLYALREQVAAFSTQPTFGSSARATEGNMSCAFGYTPTVAFSWIAFLTAGLVTGGGTSPCSIAQLGFFQRPGLANRILG